MKLLDFKSKKFLIIAIIVTIVILGSAAVLTVVLLNTNNKEKEETTVQVALNDNLQFEINSKVNLLSLISQENKAIIVSEDEIIDTSSLGPKELIIKYKDKDEEKEQKIKIEIVDTTAPTIEAESELSTTQGTKIDLLENIKVYDNSNEDIIATIEGTYDFDIEGTYNLKYVVVDSSNNKAEKEFVLKVNKNTAVQTSNIVTTNQQNTSDTNISKPSINNNSVNTSTNNSSNTNNNTNNENTSSPSVNVNSTTPSNNTNENKEEENTKVTEEKKEESTQVSVEVNKQVTTYRQEEARTMLALINKARKENGLNELKLNTSLENSAKIRAKELVTVFSHTRPNGTSAFTSITTNYYTAGENIAAGQWSVEAAFQNWMNSPGHRANILNENFTDIGISWYYDSQSEYQNNWVQLFIGQ